MTSKPVNISWAVDEMAQKQPNALAIMFPADRDKQGRACYTPFTYRQLRQETHGIAGSLKKAGILRGTRTVVMIPPSLEFFTVTFALFQAGVVPVLIDPGMGLNNLKICLSEAEPEAFIGIPKAHIFGKILGWGKKTIKHRLVVNGHLPGILSLDEIKDDIPFEAIPTQADELAAILFTSGSTGVPKGVAYTHGNFVDQVKKIRSIYQIQPGEIDLPTFPPFALFDPALGMTTIIPDMDPRKPGSVHPPNIIEPIRQFGVTNMFGSPALLDRVGRYGQAHQIQLPSLKRVISAGAPVPATVLERFHSMLKADAQIFTPYGATECLPICSIGSHEILAKTKAQTDRGAGVCIGKPVTGMDVKMIKISDTPVETWHDDLALPENEIGEIVVKGANVTRFYYQREQSTLLAKIMDGDKVRHRMGDLGYFDKEGQIWFCGRKTHRVQTENGTLYTVQCEGIFNTHPDVYRSALVGVSTEPVLCVELENQAKAKSKDLLTQELLALGAQFECTQHIKIILFHPAFPVDIRHNSKIFREKLTIWAGKKYKK